MSSQQSQKIFKKQSGEITESLLKFKKPDLQQKTYKYFKSLEGECKIIAIQYLRINYAKLICLFIPIAMTIIGLIALKLSKKFRIACLYSKVSQYSEHITHVVPSNINNEMEVCQTQKLKFEEEQKIIFTYHNLRYELYNGQPIPLGFKYQEVLPYYINESFKRSGLSSDHVQQRLIHFGKNEHIVPPLHYPQYIYNQFTNYLFLMQILSTIINILGGTSVSAIVLLGISIIIIHVNFYFQSKATLEFKKMAETSFIVKVLRNNEVVEINNSMIVPGDIYEPQSVVPCDSILIQGQLFVSEVGLTGQNVPISKTSLAQIETLNSPKHWIYEGSKILSKRHKTLALAIGIGYTTRRGQIIRKILKRIPSKLEMTQTLTYFFFEITVIVLAITFAFYNFQFGNGIGTAQIVYRLINIVLLCIPAIFNIYFHLSYAFSSVRLKNKGIGTTHPEKIIQSSRIETICFDKTGTLTENIIRIHKVLSFQDQHNPKDITFSIDTQTEMAFLTCNSVEYCKFKYLGDQIDLALFNKANGMIDCIQLEKQNRVISNDDLTMTVLRINQYQSRYQSMSVLAKDNKTGKVYIFAKGSPELMHHHSLRKIKDYDRLIKNLSLSGFRLITYGFCEIPPAQIQQALLDSRTNYLEAISILGMVVFTTHFKPQSYEIMKELKDAQVQTKIITGDNIFNGIYAGFQLGIFQEQLRVLVLQGSKINEKGQVEALFLRKINNTIEEERVCFKTEEIDQYQNEQIAIDQEFIQKFRKTFLFKGAKIFARVSPEAKGLVVKRFKQKLKYNYKKRIWQKRWFGPCINKVAMVGDGANDLVAIRQAHIGIGLMETDSLYVANFSIKSLMEISTILREGKNTAQISMQVIQHYLISNSVIVVALLLMANDSSSFTSLQYIVRQILGLSGPIICIMAWGSADCLTKYRPSSNFLGLHHHLIMWGTAIINNLGLIGSYLYYYNSQDYEPNPNDHQNWSVRTKSSTAAYITYFTITSIQPLFLTITRPWKSPLVTNIGLVVFLCINIILGPFFHLFSGGFDWVGLTQINKKEGAIMYGISFGTIVISLLYNIFVQNLKIYERQFEQDKQLK